MQASDNHKRWCRLAARIAVLPTYIAYRLCARWSELRAFQFFSQGMAGIPGVPGDYLRREFYRLTLRACSDNCVISYGTIFSTPNAAIGEHVYIGAYCILGNVDIGADSLLASRVSIVSGTKQHGIDRTDVLIREQAGEFVQVTVGSDCWIGEGAVIAADVEDHAVVGLGAVVVKPVEAYAVVGGNPAAVLKFRDRPGLLRPA